MTAVVPNRSSLLRSQVIFPSRQRQLPQSGSLQAARASYGGMAGQADQRIKVLGSRVLHQRYLTLTDRRVQFPAQDGKEVSTRDCFSCSTLPLEHRLKASGQEDIGLGYCCLDNPDTVQCSVR